MSFLDELSEYLQKFGEARGERPEPIVPSRVDAAFARNALIRCLERLEEKRAGEEKNKDPFGFNPSPAELFTRWQQNDAVVRFATRMTQLLRESMGRSSSDADLAGWIEVAIARELGLDESLSSGIRTMELDRLAKLAWGYAFE